MFASRKKCRWLFSSGTFRRRHCGRRKFWWTAWDSDSRSRLIRPKLLKKHSGRNDENAEDESLWHVSGTRHSSEGNLADWGAKASLGGRADSRTGAQAAEILRTVVTQEPDWEQVLHRRTPTVEVSFRWQSNIRRQ
jgi:hypothetical protein